MKHTVAQKIFNKILTKSHTIFVLKDISLYASLLL